MSKTLLLALAFGSLALCAQPIGGGIKLGAPFTEAFQSISTQTFQASPQHFLVGPFVEIQLPAQMAVEVDALHQSLDFSLSGVGLDSGLWEFPIVVKHKFLAG